MSKKKNKTPKKYFRGEINLFYFFLVSLAIHLAFFLGRQYNIKGDMNFNSGKGGPISVQVKSDTFKLPRPAPVSTEESAAQKPKVEKEEVTPETKEIKKEFESKIQDKKKKEKKKVEKPKKKTQPKKDTPEDKDSTSTEEKKAGRPPSNVPTDPNSDQDFLSGNFSIGEDGNIVASSAEGIEYHILKQVEPPYPTMAKKVRYSKVVMVKVKFLVGLKGQIEDIKILQGHEKLGFDKSVIDSLNKWKFSPIYYKGKNIKVYFTKEFVFRNQ